MLCTETSLWYVLWGRQDTSLHVNIYKSPADLKGWVTNEEWQNVPVLRLGKIEITETGPVEKIHWRAREDFLTQYEYL